MSRVTNLILAFSSGEDDTFVVDQLSKFQHNGKPFSIVSIADKKLPIGWYGGDKYMEAKLYIGAYNYLDLVLLVNHMKSISWQNPEDIQIIVKEQFEFKFKIIDLFEDF